MQHNGAETGGCGGCPDGAERRAGSHFSKGVLPRLVKTAWQDTSLTIYHTACKKTVTGTVRTPGTERTVLLFLVAAVPLIRGHQGIAVLIIIELRRLERQAIGSESAIESLKVFPFVFIGAEPQALQLYADAAAVLRLCLPQTA